MGCGASTEAAAGGGPAKAPEPAKLTVKTGRENSKTAIALRSSSELSRAPEGDKEVGRLTQAAAIADKELNAAKEAEAALKAQVAERAKATAKADAEKAKVETDAAILELRAKATAVFVLGGPGSGKGTQCERIVRDFGFQHFSTGDLLRAEVAAGTETGKQCEALMAEGKLVPMEITIALLKNAMIKATNKKFLIDGFPRALDQAVAFEDSIMPCSYILYFDCPLETMEQRLLKRGETSGRSDDNLEAIKKRFETFTGQSLPVVEHYEKQGKVFTISSVPPADEVYTQVNGIIKSEPEKKPVASDDAADLKQAAAQQAAEEAKKKAEAAAADAAAAEAKASEAELAEAALKIQMMARQKAARAEVTKLKEAAAAASKKLREEATIVFVLGGPGSGKGTQCERIVRDFGFKHLSAGDLLRDEVKAQTVVGKKCAALMQEGKLVPVEITLALLREAMHKADSAMFLIDGFPRALDQAEAFEASIAECSYVIYFDCPLETMQERLLKRGETSGRADDNIDTIKKRFDTFTSQSLPVITHYEGKGKAHKFSSIPPPDEVYEGVSALIKKQAEAKAGGGAAPAAAPAAEPAAPAEEAAPAAEEEVVMTEEEKAQLEAAAAATAAAKAAAEAASAQAEAAEMGARQAEAVVKIQLAARKKAARNQVKRMKQDADKAITDLRATATAVFVLGGPGSGKGTQCERIVRDYGFQHFSTGDLLRAEVAAGTVVGKKCEALMAEGKLVPMEITIALLREAMLKATNKKFLIDGFPRALDQAVAFEDAIMPCSYILYFDCPLETMEARLLKRGETSGRSDDNLEAIKKRFETFTGQSLPVITHYEPTGKVRTISSVPPADDVYEEVKKAISSGDEAMAESKKDEDLAHKLAVAEARTAAAEAAAAELHVAADGLQTLKASASVIFVLGGPGSGKGTQCERIVRDYGYQHFSTGDLLRAEVASGSELGHKCEQLMKDGLLVPMEITIALLKNAMIKATNKKFLIDGFPRALDQALAFEASILPCTFVLYFDCPLETMEQRLLKRGETSGRSDDNLEAIKKRFETFTGQSLPVVEHFKKQGKVRKISSVPAPDEVYEEVKKALA